MMATTHSNHKEYADEEQISKRKSWEKDLNLFTEEYNFLSLHFDNSEEDSKALVSNVEEGDEAVVSFTAKMQRASFADRAPEEMKEKSIFKKENGKWMYFDATIKNPFKNVSLEKVKPQQRAVKTLKKGVPKGNQ